MTNDGLDLFYDNVANPKAINSGDPIHTFFPVGSYAYALTPAPVCNRNIRYKILDYRNVASYNYDAITTQVAINPFLDMSLDKAHIDSNFKRLTSAVPVVASPSPKWLNGLAELREQSSRCDATEVLNILWNSTSGQRLSLKTYRGPDDAGALDETEGTSQARDGKAANWGSSKRKVEGRRHAAGTFHNSMHCHVHAHEPLSALVSGRNSADQEGITLLTSIS